MRKKQTNIVVRPQAGPTYKGYHLSGFWSDEAIARFLKKRYFAITGSCEHIVIDADDDCRVVVKRKFRIAVYARGWHMAE